MSKHDRAKVEKNERNKQYAFRFRQRKCRECGHKSSRRGRCNICGGETKGVY